jgi:CelD/BcsL family acetyltransferase involved in cellulose biosynthesis
MNAALRPARPATRGYAARLAIFATLSEAEPHWRALERGQCVGTPYQRFDFLSAWYHHLGAAADIEPFIIIGFDSADTALFLWPFGRRKISGLRIVEFLGGKHANFNHALVRSDFAPSAVLEIFDDILRMLRGQADALILTQQPMFWQGTANPLARLPHQLSPNTGHSGALSADFEALLRVRTNADTRKKMRKKAQTLFESGTPRFARAVTADETRRVLDTFFEQKRARMKAQGIPDVFGDPNVRRFVETLALRPGADGLPAIELYSLSAGDTIVATTGGIAGGGRFCCMFSSIIPDRFTRESPGEQILVHIVRDLCARGFTTFDLGTGEARYKRLFCNEAEPLIDSFFPLNGAGNLYVAAERLSASAKRFIKNTPAAWSLVNMARRIRGHLA